MAVLSEIQRQLQALQEEVITLRERVRVLEEALGSEEDPAMTAVPLVLGEEDPALPPSPPMTLPLVQYWVTARNRSIRSGRFHRDKGCQGPSVASRLVSIRAHELRTEYNTITPCLVCVGDTTWVSTVGSSR